MKLVGLFMFAIAVMTGSLLQLVVEEYDLPLIFLPLMALAVSFILYDTYQVYAVRRGHGR